MIRLIVIASLISPWVIITGIVDPSLLICQSVIIGATVMTSILSARSNLRLRCMTYPALSGGTVAAPPKDRGSEEEDWGYWGY